MRREFLLSVLLAILVLYWAFYKPDIKEIIYQINQDPIVAGELTPKTLSDFYKIYFIYVEERAGKDEWQEPVDFWQTKAGDCEDFAIFSASVLQKVGYDTTLVLLLTTKKDLGSHAVCLINLKDGWGILDIKQYLKFPKAIGKDVLEVVLNLYPEYEYIITYSYKKQKMKVIKLEK